MLAPMKKVENLPHVSVKAADVQDCHCTRCIDTGAGKIKRAVVGDVPSFRLLGRLSPETVSQSITNQFVNQK